jgi:ABC-2 type transport system ATP-binding protein
MQLQDELRGKPGVDQTIVFGDGLHVSGFDQLVLEHTVRSTVAGKNLRAEPVATELEDAFIYMMSHSTDNFGGQQ